MAGLFSLLLGVVLGLVWMFGIPAYLGATGGPWWGAFAWGLFTAPLSRPLHFYNRLRSSVWEGRIIRFFWYKMIGALPFAALCVGAFFASRWGAA